MVGMACTKRIVVALTISAVAASLTADRAIAHEVSAHKAITDTALAMLGVMEPALGACIQDSELRKHVLEMVEKEDAYLSGWLGNFMFHFQPTLHDHFQLNVLGHRVDAVVHSGCDSNTRGFETADCSASLHAGMVSQSFTSPAYGMHDTAIGLLAFYKGPEKVDGWKELGRLTHLLQDLTSPAHVREDAHPHLFGNLFAAQLFGDPSIYEVVNAERTVPTAVLDAPPGFNIAGMPARDLFSSLRAHTAANFHSEKSLGIPGIPPFQSNVDAAGYALDGNGHRIWRWSFGVPTIDDVVANAQFDRLSPLAVRYTVALLNYIHEHLASICDQKLTLAIEGEGSISASSIFDTDPKPAGEQSSCTAGDEACEGWFGAGRRVRLIAEARPGWRFDRWTGADCGTESECTVTMNNSKSVSAIFTEGQPVHLLVAKIGNGTLVSVPAGILCNAFLCQGTFDVGTTLTVTAIPAPGWKFSVLSLGNWIMMEDGSFGASCARDVPTCTFIIDAGPRAPAAVVFVPQ